MGVNLPDLKKLPPDANYQMHEDWVQWSFWEEVFKESIR